MNKQQPPVEGRCEQCGFDYRTGDLQGTVKLLVRQAAESAMALTRAAAGSDPEVVRVRPEPEVWSAIEYACHVRDLLEVQRQRIAQCLAEERPVYAPIDRGGRMKQEKYESQDPAAVAAALMRFAQEFGAAARVLTPDELRRLGLYNYPVQAPRSLSWIVRHTAHEIQHHRGDVLDVLARVEPPLVPTNHPAPARGERMQVREVSDVAAVLFDMDGTLVDSDAAVERSWTRWAGEYGVSAADVLAIAHGSPARTTIAQVLADRSAEDQASAAARLLEIECADLSDVVPTPGALELIKQLDRREVPWAVFTSAFTPLAKARLAAAGIEPPVLVTVDDVTHGKPDPEGYLRAAELVGVPAERCLVVEDAEVGLRAGRAAGAMTAALKGNQGDVELTDLHQLVAALSPLP